MEASFLPEHNLLPGTKPVSPWKYRFFSQLGRGDFHLWGQGCDGLQALRIFLWDCWALSSFWTLLSSFWTLLESLGEGWTGEGHPAGLALKSLVSFSEDWTSALTSCGHVRNSETFRCSSVLFFYFSVQKFLQKTLYAIIKSRRFLIRFDYLYCCDWICYFISSFP